VREYELYGKEGETWQLVSKGSCVGHKRIEPVGSRNFSGVKLKIVKSQDQPVIKELICF